MKKENGITLIALVITIIVLLVLSGVSLSLVLGDNGVINKAQNATTETRKAEEKEKIEMAVAAARAAGNGTLTTENLNIELDKVFNNGKEVEESKIRRLPAEYQEVEYIESTGTQYIDSKVIPNPSCIEIQAKMSTNGDVVEDISKRYSLFGMWSPSFNFRILKYNELGSQYSGILRIQIGGVSSNITNIPLDHSVLDIIFNSNSLTINNQIQNIQIGTNTNNYNQSIYIFSSISSTSGIEWLGYDCSIRCYNFKIFNESLVRDYVPCYSKTTVTDVDNKQCSAGTIGLYDLVEGKFYTNQGTGTFFKGKNIKISDIPEWNYETDENRKYIINNDGKVEQIIVEEKESLLPKEYQQVEYIESTGTQYIDTKFNSETGISCDLIASYREIGKNNSILAAFDKNREQRMYFAHISNPGTFWTLGYGDYYLSNKIPIKDTIYRIKSKLLNNEQEIIINEEEIIRKELSNYYNINLNMYVFAMNKNGVVDNFSKSRVYGLELFKNNILNKNFIPCYSTTTVTNVDGKQCPSNTKGMYDLVEGKFYTNQGSGDDFIAGPDV